jgi:signal transduction histidine kinase
MRKGLPTFISSLSLLILVIIQVYVINSYYKVKSKNFDMTYSKAILSTMEKNSFNYSIDTLDIILNKLASSYLFEILDTFDIPVQDDVLVKFDSLLRRYNSNPVKVRKYLFDNKLDTAFKTYYSINEISFIDFNDKIPVYKHNKKLAQQQKSKGFYINSYYKEGNYYAVQYDFFIDFTHKSKVILFEMKGLLVLVILTLSMVIFTFVYTLITLQRQKKLTELKDDFINNISHEFKTPLSIISVATASLKQEKIQSDTQKYTEICTALEKQNRVLSKMIDNVIDVSLLDRRTIDSNKELVSLKQFITELISSFVSNETAEKNVQIRGEYKISEDYSYMLDPIQFARAINNLLNNSVKYCVDDPVIKVQIMLDKELEIRIEDNGIGIREEHEKNVFNKFYRADNPIKAKGLGLGLYIVKRIIENHNGSIRLESTRGKGTTAIINLPK